MPKLLRGFDFVFELVGSAFSCGDVAALSDINWLIDRAALAEGIQKTHLDDFAGCRNRMVWRDGDVACRDQIVGIVETKTDTPLGIATCYNEGRTLDEL